jgi:hypothetical protein
MTLTIEDKKFLMIEAVKMYSYATAAAGNISAATFVLDTYRKLCAAICEGPPQTEVLSEGVRSLQRDLLREFLALQKRVPGISSVHKWFNAFNDLCAETKKAIGEGYKPSASDLIANSYAEQLRKFLELESTARLPFSDWDRSFLAICDETRKLIGE